MPTCHEDCLEVALSFKNQTLLQVLEFRHATEGWQLQIIHACTRAYALLSELPERQHGGLFMRQAWASSVLPCEMGCIKE